MFFDKPAVARFSGAPTDLAVDGTLMGVIDGGDGITSNASLFDIDPEGELKLRFAVKIAGPDQRRCDYPLTERKCNCASAS